MNQTIALIGGRGFIGDALSTDLLANGFRVRVLSRATAPEHLEPNMEWQRCDPYDVDLLAEALTGASVVINLVGILNARLLKPHDFHNAHVKLVEQMIAACYAAEVSRIIHIGALNSDANAPSEYLRTKAHGCDILHHTRDLKVTSFHPSVVFGPGDSFLLRFARLIKFAPGVFPLACPDSVFAPVFVGDLAERIRDAVSRDDFIGKRINVCGPEHRTLKQIVSYVAQLCRRRIRIVPLTKPLSYLQAQLCEIIPGKPFSVDNYLSLQLDSVCPGGTALCQTRLESIAPSYIH